MKSQDIRSNWIKFFKEKKGHLDLPSASLVPNNPTLLLTNAGMVPFVPYFLGQQKPPASRITTVQKCVRVGGKDSDLENIGKTSRHLTFFEMLGNFSFGDYFKEEVIPWSWELLTQVYGFKPEELIVSVFAGDDTSTEGKHKVGFDQEAFDIWTKKVGVPESRILKLGRADNFWGPPGGISGPCGPCSEIYYAPEDGSEPIEIWNLVFMQYEKFEDGSLQPLPKPNVDTGAGLERLATILQGRKTVFETDLMEPIVSKIRKIRGLKYSLDYYENTPREQHKKFGIEEDYINRVIADHVRCSCMLLADGVKPSNLGRGYILRMLIRRAARFGRSSGLNRPFLALLVPSVQAVFAGTYPELDKNIAEIKMQLTSEEEAFNKTIERGLQKFNEIISSITRNNPEVEVPPNPLNTITPQPPCKGESKSVVLDECLHESGVFKYNTKLLEQAKQMRENPTEAEKALWDSCLRSSLTEYKFTRQKPIDNFILDFYCSELLLGIEADGEIHEKQKEQDFQRDSKLESLGIKVIRFSNHSILKEIEKVKNDIQETISKRKIELGNPPKEITVDLERIKLPLSRGLGGNKVINGEQAFDLYATYGFPVELTIDLAEEKGFTVDLEGYEKAKQTHSEVSNQGKFAVGFKAERNEKLKDLPPTEFIYKHSDELFLIEKDRTTTILYVNDEFIVLDRTPFYPESGGQVSDTGFLWFLTSSRADEADENIYQLVFSVNNVQKRENTIIHQGELINKSLKAGDRVYYSIDFSRRQQIEAHHSATHLLHAALRKATNNEAEQRGSLVAPERLRFDFTCSQKLGENTIQEIENLVNETIKQNAEVKHETMSMQEAINKGALAFFGDKYGDEVKVLTVQNDDSEKPFSIELCGGTHVKNTSEIQGFKIISESAISSGIRRIEAVAGQAYIDYLRESDKQLDELKYELKVPREKVNERVQALQDELKATQKKNAELEKQLIEFKAQELLLKVQEIKSIKFLIEETELSNLKEALDSLSSKVSGDYIFFLASKTGEKMSYAAKVVLSPPFKGAGGVTAKDLVGNFASSVGGSGGGRPDYAQGGGGDKDKIKVTLDEINLLIKKHLQEPRKIKVLD
jgi:alanyl-tRNA synthetase